MIKNCSRWLLLAFLFISLAQSVQARMDPIPSALQGKLVHVKDGKLVEYRKLNDRKIKYYAFYFSAHWCPPCRKFTPKLVRFYDKMKEDYENFEIIFVSSDRSEDAMLEYMEWGDMKWPALKFNQIFPSTEITKYAGNGIPCLVVVDPEGNVKADSYIGSTYVGPVKPMEALGKLIERD